MRWWVTTVRQNGVDEQGQPLYESAGAISEKRVFTWVGVTVEGGEATPTHDPAKTRAIQLPVNEQGVFIFPLTKIQSN